MAAHLEDLLPDLAAWRDGKGVTPLDYVYAMMIPEGLLACCALFWPEFVEFEGYVLRRGFSIDHLRGWERTASATKLQIEAAVNYLPVGDLLPPDKRDEEEEEESALTHQRVEYLGRVLRDAWSAKLAKDFPERAFKVEIIDAEDDYALTFFQA